VPFVLTVAAGVALAGLARWLDLSTLASVVLLAAGLVPVVIAAVFIAFGPYDNATSGQPAHSRIHF
jgi:hypothetical protein